MSPASMALLQLLGRIAVAFERIATALEPIKPAPSEPAKDGQ